MSEILIIHLSFEGCRMKFYEYFIQIYLVNLRAGRFLYILKTFQEPLSAIASKHTCIVGGRITSALSF